MNIIFSPYFIWAEPGAIPLCNENLQTDLVHFDGVFISFVADNAAPPHNSVKIVRLVFIPILSI